MLQTDTCIDDFFDWFAGIFLKLSMKNSRGIFYYWDNITMCTIGLNFKLKFMVA